MDRMTPLEALGPVLQAVACMEALGVAVAAFVASPPLAAKFAAFKCTAHVLIFATNGCAPFSACVNMAASWQGLRHATT